MILALESRWDFRRGRTAASVSHSQHIHAVTSKRAIWWIFVLFAASAAIAAGRAALDITFGLNADYFSTTASTGDAPAFTTIDPEVSTAQILADWLGDPPPAFRVRWYGYLSIEQPGVYTFATQSDDGSVMTID